MHTCRSVLHFGFCGAYPPLRGGLVEQRSHGPVGMGIGWALRSAGRFSAAGGARPGTPAAGSPPQRSR
eukprot:4655922-Pyramimonas_sp.AAC.1